jgi:transcriptional regulator with XRE-family HTH domain
MDEQMKQMVGQRIREERERRGMTLEQLANAVGVASRGQMSRYESGERGVDSMLLHRIAVALEVPMDAFFDVERGAALAMARTGDATDEAMQRMADAGLELLADMQFAEELVGARGW